MAEKAYKREYFRIDTFIPLKVNVIPQHLKDSVAARAEDFGDLKPCIVNISGGGMSFKSAKQYHKGDILEIIMSLSMPSQITLWVYGEVLRVEKTKNNHYQAFIKFFNISDKIREKIVNFVFQTEREILKNTQINFGTKFVDIPLNKLIDGTLFPFEIFIKDEEGIKYLFAEGLPCDSISREFFEDKNISRIYIKADELSSFEDYIEKNRVKRKVFDRDDIVSFKEYSFNKKSYHPVDKTVLLQIKDIDFGLFVANDFIYAPLIEASPEKIVTVDENNLNAKHILIKKSDMPVYQKKLHAIFSASDDLKKIHILKENSKIVMSELFANPEDKAKMQAAIAVAKQLVDYIIKNNEAVYILFSLNIGDYYTHTHSVNVAVMSIGAGVALGLNRDSLEKLGIGALLHDIGHTVISEDIVNKQGRLSMREFEIFKTHVTEGIRILRKHEAIPIESYAAVLHHHEKLTCKGYPHGMSGDKISLFGKITAIADAYDMLTTNRPYRANMTPFQALTVFAKEARNYDPEILKAFIKILAKVK
jgi:HD-GYP domain-containing protein (c-di-GMP phosphodiesterase class II)